MAWSHSITHNLGWRIVSVLLATLVWLLVHYNTTDRGQARETRVFEGVPISLLSPPGQGGAYRLVPSTARVTLRGPARALRELRTSDLQLFVNLGAGGREPTHESVEVHLPPGFNVVSLIPPQVRVEPVPALPAP